MGIFNKKTHAEVPVGEDKAMTGPAGEGENIHMDETRGIVNTTDPQVMRNHFHARGRPETPFYMVSQVQSCNMSPLGLLGFGLTTALLQGAVTTITEAGTTSLTYCFALGYGGLAQLLAGMWEARRGKIFGAVVFSSYGAFWISFGLFGVLATPGVIEGGAASPIPKGEQMMLNLWGIITFGFFLASLALNLALQTLLLLLTVTFFLLAKGQRNTGVDEVAGWFGIVTAGVAIYMGIAELFNETHQRNIFPLFPLNWLNLLMPKSRKRMAPYDVARTEARTFPTTQHEEGYNVSRTDPRGFAPNQHDGAYDPASGAGLGGNRGPAIQNRAPADNNV